jgi:3D (Asp-Asp-Asp) domain-containing protein
MKSVFGGSAIIAAAFLSGSLVLSAKSSIAETLFSQFQQTHQTFQKQWSTDASPMDKAGATTTSSSGTLTGTVTEAEGEQDLPVSPAVRYVATAYSLRGRTASGRPVSKGVIAADPRVLPLGSRVRLEAGSYSGEYLVADTGGAVRGYRIDIWTPSTSEAFRFGRRAVKLSVLSYGGRRASANKKTQK